MTFARVSRAREVSEGQRYEIEALGYREGFLFMARYRAPGGAPELIGVYDTGADAREACARHASGRDCR